MTRDLGTRKQSSRIQRTPLLVLCVLALAAVLVAALSGTLGFSGCLASMGNGWTVPLLAGLVILVAVLILSRQMPRYRDDDRTVRHTDVGGLNAPVCGRCGSAVMVSWRLCPRCGERLDD